MRRPTTRATRVAALSPLAAAALVLAGASAAGASVGSPATVTGGGPAVAPFGLAEEQSIVVDSLGLEGDANIGDGICATELGSCTLHAALDEANAVVDDESGDAGVTITFGVSGTITVETTADTLDYRMIDVVPSVLSGSISTQGGHFLVDSEVPVTIDFAGLGEGGGVIHAFDSGAALFYIASDDVVLRNAGNIRAGEAGVAISGSNVTLSNMMFSDPDTIYQETPVALLDGASNVTLEDVTAYSAWNASVLVDAEATVSDVELVRFFSRGVEGLAHITLEDNAVVNGFTVSDTTLGNAEESARQPGIFVNPGVTVTGLEFIGSSYLTPDENFLEFFGGSQTLTDTVISGNEFVGNRQIIADGTATFDGLTFQDNTIERNFAYTILIDSATVSNALIDGNTITDIRGGGAHTSVWLSSGGADDNNVISNNTFLQTNAEGITTNLWAIWNPGVGVEAGTNTGWTIRGNDIDGYEGGAQGPIANLGAGQTIVEHNTFGPRTSGTQDVESETSVHYFVNNNNTANNLVQTWRPTEAAFTGSEVIVTVAPVTPEAGNNAPTLPVYVDVYWTADDNAEVYLGRFPEALSSSATASFATTETSGYVRLQTIDANGNSSQYSSTVVVDEAVAPAAPAIEAADETQISGTGEPGATVTVRDSSGNVIGEAVVAEDGTWVVEGEIPCDETLTAVQTTAAGESPVSEPFETQACETDDTTAPEAPTVVSGEFDGTVSGTGEPGATVTITDADGNVVCETVVTEDGTWTCTPAEDLECGETYSVTQTDAAGNVSEAATFTIDCGDDATSPTPGDDDTSGDTGGSGGGSSTLPTTGAAGSPVPGIALAALLLMTGVALVAVRFRKVALREQL